MFGSYLRAALTVPIAIVAAGIIQFATPFFLPYMGPQESLLYRSFDFLGGNALLIMLLAIGAGVMARAYLESGPRGI